MGVQENYEKLANAIIIRAVKDYRIARNYLIRHPHTKELDDIVTAQAERQRKRAEKSQSRKDRKTKQVQQERKPTREERLLRNIIAAESIVSEVEAFLQSDWYRMLTDVDGEMVLERLRAE